MATEHNNNGQFYTQPETYDQGYREALRTEGPLADLSSAHQLYEPQPQWQSSYKVQPGRKGKIPSGQRLLLALISVGMIALFSMIVLTSTQNTSTGLIGVGIMCGSIFLVNLVFNQRE